MWFDREDRVRHLNSFNEWIGHNPEIPLPDSYEFIYSSNSFVGYAFTWHLSENADPATIREIMRSAGVTSFHKNFTPNGLAIFEGTGNFPVRIITARETVCTRTVTGTHTETREVPDPNAPKIMQEVEVEDVRWDCHPLLG